MKHELLVPVLAVAILVLGGCATGPPATGPFTSLSTSASVGEVQLGPPLRGHKNIVSSVAFSPDGKTLASGSWDKTIVLWDIATRQPLGQPLSGHTGIVYSVAFSPDGKTLASGSYDSSVILWDVRNPRSPAKLATLRGHQASVVGMAFSPDGRLLASRDDGGAVILWDVSDPASPGQLGTPLQGQSHWSGNLAFSPNGRLLADTSIILWDVSDPKAPVQLANALADGGYWEVAFSPDGRTLAAAGDSGSISLWDISTPQSPLPLGAPLNAHEVSAKSVAFSPDGGMLASGGNDATVVLWDVRNPKMPVPLGILRGHRSSVESIAFAPGGKMLASGSDDMSVILWDVSDLKALALSLTPTPSVQPATMASLSTEIVQLLCEQQSHTNRIQRTTEKEGTVQVWDCHEPAVELSREQWHLPNMDPCRACGGDWSENWEVSFQIQSPSKATAEACSSGFYRYECDVSQLARADGGWRVAATRHEGRAACDCPASP